MRIGRGRGVGFVAEGFWTFALGSVARFTYLENTIICIIIIIVNFFFFVTPVKHSFGGVLLQEHWYNWWISKSHLSVKEHKY